MDGEKRAVSRLTIFNFINGEDKKGGPYVVIQSNGGGAQISTLGSEHYLLVSLIASKAMGFTIEAKAIELINYALSNPVSDFGYIENTGGIPQPIFTTDNRMILRLQFRIITQKRNKNGSTTNN